jgi:hypothetical protein
MPIKAPVLALLALGAPLFFAAYPAVAADTRSDDKVDDTKSDDSKKDDAKKGDSKKDSDKDKAAPAPEDPYDPFEDPNKPYRFIGLRFRDAVVPKFMINWFANGGRNVNAPMVGPEFITRQNHLEIAVAVMYADYSMSPFLFQGKSDPSTSWDLVQSQLKVAYAMVDILAEIPLEKKMVNGIEKTGRVALLIGGGVGVGGVFGSLYQSQAFPNSTAAASNSSNPGQWTACTSQNMPGQFSGTYCNNRSNHLAGPGGNLTTGFSQPTWVSGGDLPIVYPWIALPQISLRYKPIKQFQIKADGGFSTSGFFGGVSASYGL